MLCSLFFDKKLKELKASDQAKSNISAWPPKGNLEFKEVSMKYRNTMEPSLRGLSFEAQAGMKIGVVGRTGAGKSSIL